MDNELRRKIMDDEGPQRATQVARQMSSLEDNIGRVGHAV